MGFNKRHLPELERIKEIREKMNSDKEFLNIYLYNPDVVLGSVESMNYVKEVEDLVKIKNDRELPHI
jgi:hypothetical protein